MQLGPVENETLYRELIIRRFNGAQQKRLPDLIVAVWATCVMRLLRNAAKIPSVTHRVGFYANVDVLLPR